MVVKVKAYMPCAFSIIYAIWPAAQAHTRLHVWAGFDIISRHCGTEVIQEGRAWIRKDIWLDL